MREVVVYIKDDLDHSELADKTVPFGSHIRVLSTQQMRAACCSPSACSSGSVSTGAVRLIRLPGDDR